jgi:hypothetical protein
MIAAIAAGCTAALAQSVAITGKKVVYKRPKPNVDFKKTFWIRHPRVKASSPALSRKIESAISFEKVIPINIREEINDIQWLEEADFSVDYNKHGVLAVKLTIYGSGAYPSSSTKTVIVDTKTGRRVFPADLFRDMNGLAAMIREDQKREIAAAIEEIRKDPENNEPDPASLFTDAKFTSSDIKELTVSDKAVTFTYDYGFPHVIQALQPDGTFFYTWKRLRQFIKPGGLLTRIAR